MFDGSWLCDEGLAVTKGYLQDKLTEHSVVISQSEGLALLRKRGYIFKDEVADVPI